MIFTNKTEQWSLSWLPCEDAQIEIIFYGNLDYHAVKITVLWTTPQGCLSIKNDDLNGTCDYTLSTVEEEHGILT